jgi:hypothetical protein
MKLKTIKPVFGLILVFMLGAASGSLTTYMVARAHFNTFSGGGPHMKEEVLLQRLTRQLDLDDQQQEQIKSIIHETHGEIRQIRQKARPEIEALLTHSQLRISALLRPHQQEIFKKMVEEHKARRQMDHHQHSGGE